MYYMNYSKKYRDNCLKSLLKKDFNEVTDVNFVSEYVNSKLYKRKKKVELEIYRSNFYENTIEATLTIRKKDGSYYCSSFARYAINLNLSKNWLSQSIIDNFYNFELKK